MARNKRKNRFYPCPKCGHKTILARSCVDDFEPDDEPYEPDVRESIEDNIAASVLVAIHYCGRCYKVVDAWIEDPSGRTGERRNGKEGRFNSHRAPRD